MSVYDLFWNVRKLCTCAWARVHRCQRVSTKFHKKIPILCSWNVYEKNTFRIRSQHTRKSNTRKINSVIKRVQFFRISRSFLYITCNQIWKLTNRTVLFIYHIYMFTKDVRLFTQNISYGSQLLFLCLPKHRISIYPKSIWWVLMITFMLKSPNPWPCGCHNIAA